MVDATGRKIGVVWGRADEKRRTVALLAASWSLERALRRARAQLASTAPSFCDPAFRATIAEIDAALAETENCP